MSKDNLAKRAAEVIKTIKYMNIATVTPEGDPWNTPVFFAYDKQLNLYTHSWNKNQHSINIESSGKAFITIYDSTTQQGEGFGVYIQAKAKVTTSPKELLAAVKTVYKRLDKPARAVSQFLGAHPKRGYMFILEKMWVNGDTKIKGRRVDNRIEVNIPEVIKQINQ